MSLELTFSLLFLSQILLVSMLLPVALVRKAKAQMDLHPESSYPRLYPKGRSFYELRLRKFGWANAVAVIVGLFFWVTYNLDSTNEDYAGIVWLVFMLQSVPYMQLEFFAFKTWRLMRQEDSRRVRSASLQPRRLADIFGATQVVLLGLAFVGLCAFIAYVDQYNYAWFGGWLNAAILAATYLVLGSLVGWQFLGMTKDPYLTESDRIKQYRRMANQFVFVCIALTVYAMVVITLKVWELNAMRQLAMTVYCQILMVGYYLTMIRPSNTNFEVYRDQEISPA